MKTTSEVRSAEFPVGQQDLEYLFSLLIHVVRHTLITVVYPSEKTRLLQVRGHHQLNPEHRERRLSRGTGLPDLDYG